MSALPSTASQAADVLLGDRFTENDAVLVSRADGRHLYAWQANKPMVPASLTKLVTAYFAIQRWGLEHRFHTDFYRHGDVLWVKGFGDPFLVSEELDVVAYKMRKLDLSGVKALYIDNSHFDVAKVPGRSRVRDPYNAPLSAVAANFNTAKLRRDESGVYSAEAQTPLTQTAVRMSRSLSNAPERVNLMTANNAQQNFAELLAIKLGLGDINIKINQPLDSDAQLIYQHHNSHTMANVVQGMLEFSNNFIANQVFLALGKRVPLNFADSQDLVETQLAERFGWKYHSVIEGSGLSRLNRLSARQIDDLLAVLEPNRELLKQRKFDGAVAHAKTGTLDGVRTFAGFIEVDQQPEVYRFVFMFNRNVPWRYRDKLLARLVEQLKDL